MGKSPGKWIKTVLFGMKSSKSSFAKNAANGKKASSDANDTTGDFRVDPVITDVPPQTTHRNGENTKLERDTCTNLACDIASLNVKKGTDTEGDVGLISANNSEIVRQEQAATKAQAVFRGYMARRAFRALKGIIRLQALIRGHLVRRQAVATLLCMQAIVKLQAVVRGRRVRLSHAGCEVLHKSRSRECKMLYSPAVNTLPKSEKLARNVFVPKLVASSPSVMHLSLQYDPVEPNSVTNWLERWSSSRFWEPIARPKKSLKSKQQKKQASMQSLESGRPKKAVQSNSLHSSSEYDKSKCNRRKSSSHQTETVQEPPQNELQRVKCSLRKVSVSAEDASDKPEAVTEKLQRSMKKVSKGMDTSSEKKASDPTVAVSEQPVVVEPSPNLLTVDDPVEMVQNYHPSIEIVSLESGEKVITSDKVKGEISSKEDQIRENCRTEKRRSFPGKQEYPENVAPPSLPSYMSATESAKAKLRAQGSPRLVQDGSAEDGFVRRRSLPSSTNGKLSSLSPRVQRPVVQVNGKGGNRSDKSMLSSRDGNEKVLQLGWRR